MNKIIIAAFLLLTVTISGCRKDNSKATNHTAPSPVSIIMGSLMSDTTIEDFNILTSTTHPVSLYENYSLSRSSTIIQAFSRATKNEGDFGVNNTPIPYKGSTYFLQTDSNIASANFTGVSNYYAFITKDSFPSFQNNVYSPATTDLAFSGLVNNKISSTNGFTLTWTPDSRIPKDEGVVVLYAINPDSPGVYVSSAILVKDTDGSLAISAGELSKFSGYFALDVFYGRGYSTLQAVSGKKINYTFINFSWASLLFN